MALVYGLTHLGIALNCACCCLWKHLILDLRLSGSPGACKADSGLDNWILGIKVTLVRGGPLAVIKLPFRFSFVRLMLSSK